MNFVDTLLKLLKIKGINKNKMLTDLNLGKNSFVNWSKRGTIPNGETLTKIADYFGVSTDYLLGNTKKTADPPLIDEETAEIIELYNELDQGEKDLVMTMIKKLLK